VREKLSAGCLKAIQWDGPRLYFEANLMTFIIKILQTCQKYQIAPNLMIHDI
jgi:hypothetical protein